VLNCEFVCCICVVLYMCCAVYVLCCICVVLYMCCAVYVLCCHPRGDDGVVSAGHAVPQHLHIYSILTHNLAQIFDQCFIF